MAGESPSAEAQAAVPSRPVPGGSLLPCPGSEFSSPPAFSRNAGAVPGAEVPGRLPAAGPAGKAAPGSPTAPHRCAAPRRAEACRRARGAVLRRLLSRRDPQPSGLPGAGASGAVRAGVAARTARAQAGAQPHLLRPGDADISALPAGGLRPQPSAGRARSSPRPPAKTRWRRTARMRNCKRRNSLGTERGCPAPRGTGEGKEPERSQPLCALGPSPNC